MSVRVVIFSVISAFAFALPVNVAAQGDVPARPLTATAVSDADYPLLSLVSAEQGRTALNVSVAANGRVLDATVASSSGSQRLDQEAVRIARTRWNFQPATRNGQPIASSVPVEVTWVLPLQPATQAYLQAPPLPNGAQPPRMIERPVALAGDYPTVSMERREQGVAGIRYLVRADGSIGDVQLAQSSGFSRLDEAALRLVRERWRSEPARAGGNPVEAWHTAAISFALLPVNSAGAPQRCYEQPILGRESALIAGERDFVIISDLDMERLMRWYVRPVGAWVPLWTQVSNTGAVSDALIETRNGWMRLNGAWTQALTRDRHYPRTAGACWYYDPAAILG